MAKEFIIKEKIHYFIELYNSLFQQKIIMEIQHPGQLLQQKLTSKKLTQKNFASMIGKKVSEVNELIK